MLPQELPKKFAGNLKNRCGSHGINKFILLLQKGLYPKRACKALQIKKLGEYHDLYVESDTSLLIDVFNNFWNMCLDIYGLNPAHFLSAPGLS